MTIELILALLVGVLIGLLIESHYRTRDMFRWVERYDALIRVTLRQKRKIQILEENQRELKGMNIAHSLLHQVAGIIDIFKREQYPSKLTVKPKEHQNGFIFDGRVTETNQWYYCHWSDRGEHLYLKYTTRDEVGTPMTYHLVVSRIKKVGIDYKLKIHSVNIIDGRVEKIPAKRIIRMFVDDYTHGENRKRIRILND